MAHYDVRTCDWCGEKFIDKENEIKTELLSDPRVIGETFAKEFGGLAKLAKGIAKGLDNNKYFCSEECKHAYEAAKEEEERLEALQEAEERRKRNEEEAKEKRQYLLLCMDGSSHDKPQKQLKTFIKDYEDVLLDKYSEDSDGRMYYAKADEIGSVVCSLIEKIKTSDSKLAEKMQHKYNTLRKTKEVTDFLNKLESWKSEHSKDLSMFGVERSRRQMELRNEAFEEYFASIRRALISIFKRADGKTVGDVFKEESQTRKAIVLKFKEDVKELKIKTNQDSKDFSKTSKEVIETMKQVNNFLKKLKAYKVSEEDIKNTVFESPVK